MKASTGSVVAFATTAYGLQQFLQFATGDDAAAQRSDPIVNPGAIAGHVHDFLGSDAFHPELTYEKLQGDHCVSIGAADASQGGNALDNSVYWHPSLYAETTNGTGYMKIPSKGHKTYYRKLSDDMKEFPHGFRMIAGDPELRSSPNTQYTKLVEWRCVGVDVAGPEDGSFPEFSTPCDVYTGLIGNMHFPHCWNGNDFDENDPHAHVAYPEGGDPQNGNCPSSHPTVLPHIFMENQFEVNSIWDDIDPSTITLSQGDPTGFGYHLDFFNGWADGAIPDLFDSCPQGLYGNMDVGECGSYKAASTPRSDCKFKKYFDENVELPGKSLVGCNPITNARSGDVKKLAVAALGGSCGSSDSGSDSNYDSSESSSSSAASYSAPAPAAPPAYSVPTTTFAVTTSSAPAPAPSASYGGNNSWDTASADEGDDDDDYDIEWVTEWATATAYATETAHAKRDAHRHNHMRAHRRRNF